MKPVDAVVAVTWRCNARCAMCGIWRGAGGTELAPEAYVRLPASLRDLNLTGGEPFLRSDLPAVHAACRAVCPGVRTIVSTNGLLTDRILESVEAMRRSEPDLGIAISLDGPPHVHDAMRGIPGAHEAAMETLRLLQQNGVRNLRLAFTATAANVDHMAAMYDTARELGVEFTCAVEHTSEHYFHTTRPASAMDRAALREQVLHILRAELGTASPKRWARAYFIAGQYAFVAGRGRPLPCRAGRDHFFLDPEGNVFTCNAAPYAMGNLATTDFAALWRSPEADGARRKSAACRPGCWMVCTARTAIRAAAPRVLAWALRRKLFGVSLDETPP